MTYPLLQTNFWFRVGENPEESLKRLIESWGVNVIQISNFPLSLSGGTRMQVYLDPRGKDTSDIRFSLEAHAGFLNIPTTIFIGDPVPEPPPPPPPSPVPIKRIRVLVSVLNIRALPISGDVLRTVSLGDILPVYEVDLSTGWYRINFDKQEWVTKNPTYVVDA